MMSRPARYSAALAGSSGCGAVLIGALLIGALLIGAVLLGPLFVGDDRADPVADARIASDQPGRSCRRGRCSPSWTRRCRSASARPGAAAPGTRATWFP